MRRKRRTRQHVIADLSVNHVERHVLLSGFTVERLVHDYGVDLMLTTYDDDGQVENGRVLLQLKATDHLRVLADGQTVSVTVARADLEAWLREPLPVILVIYDAQADVAYWLYLQPYFEGQPGFALSRVGRTVTVRVPMTNRIDRISVRRFRRFRDGVLARFGGVIRHEA